MRICCQYNGRKMDRASWLVLAKFQAMRKQFRDLRVNKMANKSKKERKIRCK